MKNTPKQIENCLISELSNMIDEFKLKTLTEDIYNYFKKFLIDSNVDSEIVVKVLEYKRFGKLGKEARNIKINEGW